MTKTQKQLKDDHGKSQAIAQLASIIRMVKALDKDTEAAQEAIQEDPLSLEVRSDWRGLGSKDEGPSEFKILLCTGGPAVQIIGQLGAHGEPERVTLQYQDWFTPWTDLQTTAKQDEYILTYCQQFYFGE